MTAKRIDDGLKLIGTVGYPGLFLGLALEFMGIPFPGEVMLTFTGFLVTRGHLHFGAALFSAVFGSVTGTVMAFFLGRRFGRPLLNRYGRYFFIDTVRIDMAERWFNRNSLLVLLFGRFVPGVRPLSSYSAGIARMRFRVFLPMSMAGSCLWCVTFIYLGQRLGKNWQRITGLLEKYDTVMLVGLFLIAACYLTWKAFIRKKGRKL